jgi:DNA-binding NarL/FixJ family response regulator
MNLSEATTEELTQELALRIGGGARARDFAWHRATCLAITRDGPVVVQQAANRHFLLPSEIMGRSRIAEISLARQEAMVELRRRGYSLAQIAGFFHRDHGTVVHAIKRLKRKATEKRP